MQGYFRRTMPSFGPDPQTFGSVVPEVLVAMTVVVGLLTAGGLLLRRRIGRSAATRTSPPSPATARMAEPPELESLMGVSRIFDRSRRLLVAEELVSRELLRRHAPDWMVERHVLIGEHRIPFVIVGPGGVFPLCVTDGAWTQHDMKVLSLAADALGDGLPAYDGPIESVVCLAFDDQAPRTWQFSSIGWRGGWLMGLSQLWPWLNSWSPEHGVRVQDIHRLEVQSGPHWRYENERRLPASPNYG